MDQMPLVAVIFYSIPESMILFAFGMTIVGEYIKYKRVLIAGTISAFAAMLIRSNFPVSFCYITAIMVSFLLFWKLFFLKPWKAIIASLTSLILLAMIETITVPIILEAQNLTVRQLWEHNFKRIIVFYPDLLIFGLVTYFLYKKKISLIRGSRVACEDNYNTTLLIITYTILTQGMFLLLLSEYLIFSNKTSIIIKSVCIIFFISSILTLNLLYNRHPRKAFKQYNKRSVNDG